MHVQAEENCPHRSSNKTEWKTLTDSRRQPETDSNMRWGTCRRNRAWIRSVSQF